MAIHSSINYSSLKIYLRLWEIVENLVQKRIKELNTQSRLQGPVDAISLVNWRDLAWYKLEY